MEYDENDERNDENEDADLHVPYTNGEADFDQGEHEVNDEPINMVCLSSSFALRSVIRNLEDQN